MIGLLTALIASLMMFSAGNALLRILPQSGRRQWHPAEHIAYAWATGMTLWMTLLIPVMLFGLSVLGFTLFLLVTGCLTLAGLGHLPRFKAPERVHLWSLFLLIILAMPYCIHILLPNTGWDAAELHLPLSKLFITRGNLFTHPVFYKFAITGGVQQIYGLFQFTGCPAAIIPLNFVAYIMTICLVYGWTQRCFSSRAALLASGGLISTSIVSELAIEPRIDGFLAFFAGVALLSAIDLIRQPSNRAALYLSALATGAGLATKYSMIFSFIVIGVVVLARMIQTRSIQLRTLCVALVLVSMPSAFWYIRNTLTLNDPIYPFLINRQYPDLSGERFNFPKSDVTRQYLKSLPDNHPINVFAARQEAGLAASATPGSALNIIDILLNPSRYTRKPGLSLSPLLLLFIGLPLIRRRIEDWALVFLSLSIYLILATQSHLIRYMVMVIPTCAIGAGAVLDRLSRYRWSAAGLAIIVIGLCGFNSFKSWQRLYDIDAISLLTGAVTEDRWISEVGYNNSRELFGALERLNSFVSEGEILDSDILLMIGEGKGDRLKMRYIPDGSWNGHIWQYLWLINDGDPDRLLRTLKRLGVTHIMFNPTLFNWVMRSTDSRRQAIAFTHVTASDFIATHCQPMFQRGHMTVGKIRYPADIVIDSTVPDPRIPYLY